MTKETENIQPEQTTKLKHTWLTRGYWVACRLQQLADIWAALLMYLWVSTCVLVCVLVKLGIQTKWRHRNTTPLCCLCSKSLQGILKTSGVVQGGWKAHLADSMCLLFNQWRAQPLIFALTFFLLALSASNNNGTSMCSNSMHHYAWSL